MRLDRPPVPLHAGHVALLLTAGEFDGVVGKVQIKTLSKDGKIRVLSGS